MKKKIAITGKTSRVAKTLKKYFFGPNIIYLEKKKFDTEGSFATFNQFLSSLLTLIIVVLILFSSILDKSLLIAGILASSISQMVVEFNFLIFAKKHYGLKMIFFSLYGIHVINLGIILGVVYFIFRKIFFIK